MNWADWTIVGILAISSLISIKRGFVKEAISLAIWGIAFFVSVAFHERMATLLQVSVESASLRYLLSFVALFAATFVVGSMVKYLIGELVKMTGLSGTDRLFGMAFGLARGVIVIMALLILLPMAFPVNQDSWWQQSILIPQFLLIEQWCKDTFTLLLDVFGRLMP
ncbi:CvpA family protein [Oceanicoccus sagamiensis]|uniref:Colicin V production CvpA n=1 Tax=Oceanicoccus sagamiensis TaxID=716816 RepID=A0A1X9NP34_9GAMM|nr:CvpA family protein [Oceanicoccus sagamiensis]ARN76497.1 colicin V production CvpA [Oceanicoccus sagamiensis]